jgi:hypothetical protein
MVAPAKLLRVRPIMIPTQQFVKSRKPLRIAVSLTSARRKAALRSVRRAKVQA